MGFEKQDQMYCGTKEKKAKEMTTKKRTDLTIEHKKYGTINATKIAKAILKMTMNKWTAGEFDLVFQNKTITIWQIIFNNEKEIAEYIVEEVKEYNKKEEQKT